jgi:diacylglycerol kinase family enzyme
VSVGLVVNPRSGGGATGSRVDTIVEAVQAHAAVEVFRTEGPGDGTRQARRAVRAGHDRVVAVGGDGTVHEVVNGLFRGREPIAPGVVFGVIHGGTGGDYVRSLKVPGSLADQARLAATGEGHPVDLLHVRFVDHEGRDAERICVNVLGFGMNGAVVKRANASSKRLGGRVTFAAATLRTFLSYRAPAVTVHVDRPDGSEHHWEGQLTSAFLAVGAYCGGGMWVGRGGRLDDGIADLTLIPDLPLLRSLGATPRLYSGTVGNVKEVSTAQVVKLVATARDGTPVLVDLDGEQPGRLPLTVEVLEKKLVVARL